MMGGMGARTAPAQPTGLLNSASLMAATCGAVVPSASLDLSAGLPSFSEPPAALLGGAAAALLGSAAAQPSSAMPNLMGLTRRARRLHVGNLPIGVGLTAEMLKQFFNAALTSASLHDAAIEGEVCCSLSTPSHRQHSPPPAQPTASTARAVASREL
jgi:hypothetical protein